MHRSDQEENRLQKRESLRQSGSDPYGSRFERTGLAEEVAAGFLEGKEVSVAGRLSAKRGHGGLTFADLRDASGKIQLCVKQEIVGEALYNLFSDLDLGDIVGASGALFKTKTGQVTVQAKQLRLLSKALRPPPEKWHGLKDVEIRYRKRYLDLIANEEVRAAFQKRGRLLSSLRQSLEKRSYIEVETPMLQPMAGGAAGEPFVTHHNALDIPLYLRLAPELYLKRLLVGGLDKVYEMNRCFRNEGLSTQHNPEFTMLEVYAAYEDCATMKQLVQDLILEAAQLLVGQLSLSFRGQTFDLTPPWDEVSFAGTMKEMGLAADSPLEEFQSVLAKRGINVKGQSRSQLVRVVEQLFEPKTRTKPLFVVDYWTELSPLAKSNPDNPLIADRFELFLGGMEIANAYSELNDPVEQRKRFVEQLEAAGGKASDRRIDEDFVEALEYGMPPAGGLGVGIDRLAMILMNQPTIKDVILFPLQKQAEQGNEEKESPA